MGKGMIIRYKNPYMNSDKSVFIYFLRNFFAVRLLKGTYLTCFSAILLKGDYYRYFLFVFGT